jgi:hypothetical protein
MSDTTPLPTAEQTARAQWDLLLTDLEYRAEQLRQSKAYEPRRLVIQGVTAAGVVFGGGAAFGALALRLIQGG